MHTSEAVIPSISSVATQIFAEISATNQVTDEQLSSLHLLFDKHFEKAVQLVDQSGVFGFIGHRSQREVFQVQGHRSGDRYTVFPRHYCSCQSFFYDVTSKAEAVYCKHQLAVQLAQALGKARTTAVSELVISEILEG